MFLGLYEKARKIPPPSDDSLPFCKKLRKVVVVICLFVFFWVHFCEFFVFNNKKNLGNLSFFWGGICLGEVVNLRGVGSVQGFGNTGNDSDKTCFFP